MVRPSTLALAVLGLLAVAGVAEALNRPSQAIPPGTNCNKSCYSKANLVSSKKIVFKLCKVSGVVIISTKAPAIADMRDVCLTYIYHKFPSPAAMVKYQNCEANTALYVKNMLPGKPPNNFWGNQGKPPKFSAC